MGRYNKWLPLQSHTNVIHTITETITIIQDPMEKTDLNKLSEGTIKSNSDPNGGGDQLVLMKKYSMPWSNFNMKEINPIHLVW